MIGEQQHRLAVAFSRRILQHFIGHGGVAQIDAGELSVERREGEQSGLEFPVDRCLKLLDDRSNDLGWDLRIRDQTCQVLYGVLISALSGLKKPTGRLTKVFSVIAVSEKSAADLSCRLHLSGVGRGYQVVKAPIGPVVTGQAFPHHLAETVECPAIFNADIECPTQKVFGFCDVAGVALERSCQGNKVFAVAMLRSSAASNRASRSVGSGANSERITIARMLPVALVIQPGRQSLPPPSSVVTRSSASWSMAATCPRRAASQSTRGQLSARLPSHPLTSRACPVRT